MNQFSVFTKVTALSVVISVSVLAQEKKNQPENWQVLNPKSSSTYGAATDDALKLLKDKKSKTVIVGVIDSGVEIDHEDLKDNVWTNTKEIPDNGKDDDNNGYIDDVYGWSFLGGKDSDIQYEATELARLYQRYNRKFSKMDTLNLKGDDVKEFEKFRKIRPNYFKEQSNYEAQAQQIELLQGFIKRVKTQTKGDFTKQNVKAYVPENAQDEKIKARMKMILSVVDGKELDSQIEMGAGQILNIVKLNKMNVDSIRMAVVGDNPYDVTQRFYGCNRVEGPDALHGTHVAGIIAAVRNNQKGIQGEAVDVKIMAVRAVPNGDERDKDVANAIRYAVDNGASIINMSFGKYYYSDKPLVDEAIRYAESKDVLLVHAAGNDSKNKDIEDSYPTRILDNGKVASNWLEVGANGHKKGKKLLGSFSNYGKTTVDLFAPGVDIYSTIPDNKYIYESGTSMASPSAAGVAAIIRGYFPELSAAQVREVLMKSVHPYKKKVRTPGSKKKTKVKELCISGGLINAENAVQLLLKK